MEINNILSEVQKNLNDPNRWIDPYDSEKIGNRYVRGVFKRIALFYPTIFYKLNIFEKNVWDENFIMLGQAALNLKRKDLVKTALEKLGVPTKNYWGLPIDWHSGQYIFPRGMIMSTTTSEGILFLCEVYKTYPDLIDEKYLLEAADNLLGSLNNNRIKNTNDFLYSYTPMDQYQVFNSNLLIAAAIGVVGSITRDEKMVGEAKRIYSVCEKYIPLEGFVPYYIFGLEETADSYHQLFSMRAVYYLHEYKIVDSELLERLERYFFEKFNLNNHIVLKPDSTTLDLQPYAEALRYYGVSGNGKRFEELYNSKYNLMKKNEYIQRVWMYQSKFKIKSNVCHSRQGYLRLLLALSYRNKL